MRTNRRSVLFGLGIVSVTPLLAWQKPVATEVATAKPDASRFANANPQQGRLWPCKLTSEDSAGTLSIFELHTCRGPDQFAMFTIAKMSGTTYSPVTSYSRRETTSTTCNKVKESGSQEAFLTFGQTQAIQRESSYSLVSRVGSRSSLMSWERCPRTR